MEAVYITKISLSNAISPSISNGSNIHEAFLTIIFSQPNPCFSFLLDWIFYDNILIILFLLHSKILHQDSRTIISPSMYFLFSMHIVMLFSRELLIVYTFFITLLLAPFVLKLQFWCDRVLNKKQIFSSLIYYYCLIIKEKASTHIFKWEADISR